MCHVLLVRRRRWRQRSLAHVLEFSHCRLIHSVTRRHRREFIYLVVISSSIALKPAYKFSTQTIQLRKCAQCNSLVVWFFCISLWVLMMLAYWAAAAFIPFSLYLSLVVEERIQSHYFVFLLCAFTLWVCVCPIRLCINLFLSQIKSVYI